MIGARILSLLTLATVYSASATPVSYSLRESKGIRRASSYTSSTSSDNDNSCSCDDVSEDMCETCYTSGDNSNCCDFNKCCEVNDHGDDDKWGGSDSGSSSGGSSGSSSGSSSWGGGAKPKPKPKPHPKPKPKPKPKPHPKPPAKPSGGGKWSSGGGGEWHSGEPSPDPTSSPTSSPTTSPTKSSVCKCDIFSDQSCANCFEGTGTCPDQNCAEECCQVKECVCDAYNSTVCESCFADKGGSCPDVDCAYACCSSYDPEGDSFSPKYGVTVGSMNYKAKSMNATAGVPGYMSFTIFVLMVGSALAAIAYSSRRSTRNLDASEPLTRSSDFEDMESKGTVSTISFKDRNYVHAELYQSPTASSVSSVEITPRQYYNPRPSVENLSEVDVLDLPDILEANEMNEDEYVEEMLSVVQEEEDMAEDFDEPSPSDLFESEEIRASIEQYENS